MAKKAEANFGEMLTEAIYAIKKCQHKGIAIIQDELGYALEPIRTGNAVERWRYGAIPPSVVDVEDLARTIIKRSCNHFDKEWLNDFLVSAGHPYPEKLCQDLFPPSAEQDQTKGRQPPGISQRQANRERSQLILIDRVKRFWIQGVLEQSIHRYVLLELKLEEKPDLIDCPWDAILQIPNQPERFLSSGMRVIDIFDEMNRAMLILGGPGAGKTTMLLVLARDAMQRAEQDTRQPIPVVFNLTSWEGNVTELAEWLVRELKSKYQIPRVVGRAWIEDNSLLLLLDGLDEVKPTQQVTCIEAINYFRLHYGLTDIAVCSRLFEYEALSIQLKLEGAVLLQPLDRRQINKYLAAAGPRLANLRISLGEDTVLQELAQSPLMLNIMSLAYQDGPGKLLTSPVSDSLEMYRDHLFARYVEQMLRRRTSRQPYSLNQTAQWLTWLASSMVQQSQTLFLLEQIEPAWLGRDTKQYKLYSLLSRLIGGLLGIFLVSMLGGLIGGLVSSEIGDSFNFDWELGVIGGLIGWYIGDHYSSGDKINIVERLTWSWKSVTKNYVAIISISLLAVGVIGLFFVIPFGWTMGILVTVLGGTIILLIVAFISGLTAVDIETKTRPNQGVWQSGKSALNVGMALGLIMFVIFVAFGGILGLIVAINQKDPDLLLWTLEGIEHLTSEAVIFGCIVGLSGGLLYGGLAFIQYYLLRIILCINNLAPCHYVHFLDYAVERILLQKVGGGYIFIHRLLLEYFSGLKSENQPEQSRSKSTFLKAKWVNRPSNIGLSPNRRMLKYVQLLALAISIVVYGPTIFSRVAAVSYNFQANEYRASNKFDEALAGYDRAIELNPNYARAYYNRGRIYQLAGNYEAAISDYNVAIELDIEDETVYLSRGRTFLLWDKYNYAVEDFNKVIELNPDLVDAYYNRGRAYQLGGDLEVAELDYHKAIEVDPNYARAYFNLAGVYADLGNLEAAIENFHKAIELGLENAESYHSLGVAYELSDNYQRALENYGKAIELDPTYARAYYNRANLYLKMDDLESALPDFNEAIALGWENKLAYYGRGRLYQLMGDQERAILDYNRAIELDSGYARAYYNRAGIYRKQANFSQAIEDYSKAIELGIRNATVFYERGFALSESGELEKAILDYTKAIELDPEMSKAYYNRGYAYANSGNIAKAIDDFEYYLTFDIPEETEKEVRDLIELLSQ